MGNPFHAGVGGVLSADIAVPEHDKERIFYSRVLATGQAPLWREDLMNNRGLPVIGLGASSPEYASLPLQWMPHIQVADVGRSVERALQLGGTELMHGKDDDGRSQWAVLADPLGAAFGLIPVVAADAVDQDPMESMGRIAGLSLAVTDPAAAGEFYEQVIGWVAGTVGTDGVLAMRRPDGESAAEICGAVADIPPVWILHLPVGNLEESLRLVAEGGGQIILRSAGTGHAVIRDPVGVPLALQGN